MQQKRKRLLPRYFCPGQCPTNKAKKNNNNNNKNKMAWPKVKMFLIRFIYTKCQQLMVGQRKDKGRSGKYQSQVLADKQAYNGQQTNMQPFWNNNAQHQQEKQTGCQRGEHNVKDAPTHSHTTHITHMPGGSGNETDVVHTNRLCVLANRKGCCWRRLRSSEAGEEEAHDRLTATGFDGF